MTTLKPAVHSFIEGTICEIWSDGDLIGTIYPTARGVKLVSKHLANRYRPDLVAIDTGENSPLQSFDGRPIGAVTINVLP